MQNKLRKVLAFIGVLAMLCTLLPMGALTSVSAADDVVFSWDFESGINGWNVNSPGTIEAVSAAALPVANPNAGNGAMKHYSSSWNFTSYKSGVTVQANTDYVLSFEALATSGSSSINVMLGTDYWFGGNVAKKEFSVSTTAWQTITLEFNSGSKTKLYPGWQPAGGGTYYIDNLTITKKEVVEPETPEGGSGETTYEVKAEKNWNDGTAGTPFFKAGSAVAEGPDGSYCWKWSATGNWSATSMTLSGFETNTDYLVKFKMKTSAAAKLFITIEGRGTNTYHNVSFKTTSEWADYEIVVNTEDDVNSAGEIYFKFQDTDVAQDVWVDDLVISKIIYPEVEEEEDDDNLALNPGFETGDFTNWKKSSSATIVAGGNNGSAYAAQLSNVGQYVSALSQDITVKTNTVYVVTWYSKRVSGSDAFNLYIDGTTKVEGKNWMNETSGNWVANTYTVNSGSKTSITLKFSTEVSGTNAGTILIDDVFVKEIPQASDDGFIKNGDFETGENAPWTTYLGTTVAKEAANNGKYGLMVSGNGSGYPGLAYQDFATEVGHRYAVTFSYKAVSNGVNVQIKQTGAEDVGKWINGTSWATYTLEFDAVGTTARINICGSGDNKTDTVYLDDFKVVEVKDPTFDGYIWNGDFEAGSLTRWEVAQQTVLSAEAAKNGKYGAKLIGNGGWGGCLTQKNIAVEVGKTYKLSFWYKAVKDGLNMTLKDQDNQNTKLAGNYLSKKEWTLYEATFESGYVTKLVLNFSGSGENNGDELWIDDIKIENLSGDEMDRCEILKNSGTSIRDVDDDNRGLAFRFAVNVTGAQFEEYEYANGTKIGNNKYVSGSGTMQLFKYDDAIGTLIEAGAVVTNDPDIGEDDLSLADVDGKKTIQIPAKYITAYEDNGDMFYAVRIVNIPEDHTADEIYARPYYTYEIDGEQVTIYGDTNDESYDAVASVRRSLKVLAIGNSFSVDAMKNYLYDVLKSAEYDQVILGNLYVGGCSIDTHWNYINSNSGSYEYQKNDDNGQWVSTYNATAMDALKDEAWDVITVQQVSSNSGMPETYGNLQNIVNWVNQYKTNPDAKVMWHMTWAYQQDSTHEAFPNYNRDQMTMYNAIVNTVQNTVLNVNGIDGVIPAGTAIQNLRQTSLGDTLTADGYHLNDQHGDYTASLTWYAALTGESLDLVDYAPASVTNHVFNIKRAVGRAIINPYEVSDMGETVLLAGTDFQASTWEKNFNNINGILGGIENTDGYKLFDGLLFTGDYTPNHGHDNATEGIAELDNFTNGFVIGNKIFSEGNHDAPTVEKLSPYGNNDPVGGSFGAFVIHEEDYGQFGGTSANDPAADLRAYFDEKIQNNWDRKKPIFVLTHVPLHFNWRTISDHGAGKNAQGIVESLNYGGENGFNVIFLFGHNHSGDYDAYLGGASIYLAKGDTMLIAKPENHKEYQEVELKFTYMNSGYVGYHVEQGPDWTLTMTTFKIQADGSVIITRYDKDGYHNLKAKGQAHTPNKHIEYIPVNETVYGPQRIVTATTDEPYNG